MVEKKRETTATEALEYIEGMNLVDAALYIVLADAKVITLKKDLEETVGSLAEVTRDNEGLRICKGSLQDSLTETLDNLMVANKRHDGLLKKLQRANSDKYELQNGMASLRDSLTENREELRVATRDLNGLREAMACLRDSLAEFRQDKKDLQVTVENVVADRDELKSRVQVERQARMALHDQGRRRLDRENILRERLAEREEELTEMVADLEYAEGQVKELKAAYDRLALMNLQEDEVADLKAQLKDKDERLSRALDSCESLSRSKAYLQDELVALQEKLE